MTFQLAIEAQVASTPTSTKPLAELGLPELHVQVTGQGFEGLPKNLSAGRYFVTLGNRTLRTVSVDFVQLPEWAGCEDVGVTAPEVEATPNAGSDETAGDWTYFTYTTGGPGASPGQSAKAVVDLKPGAYVVQSDDPFFELPRVCLVITGEFPSSVPAPAPDVTVVQTDTDTGFAFDVDGVFRTGRQLVEIRNMSHEPHTFELIRSTAPLTEDPISEDSILSLMQRRAYRTAYMSVQSSGTTTWLEIDLSTGDYVLACFVPDQRFPDSYPHALEGMAEVISVE